MEIKFLKRGNKDCMVIIPENAAMVEKTAAEELQIYIEKALSVKLDIVYECAAKGKGIYIGMTEYAKMAGVSGKSKENWIIKMDKGNLILTGGSKNGDRGIIYSVYHFLEDYMGIRWWNPKEEDVLKLDELCLAEDLYKEGTPAFYYRKTFMHPGAGIDAYPYMVRTRTNVLSPLDDGIEEGVYHPDVRKYGDVMVAGRPHHSHVMGKYFPADEYFDKHPEWWAWNKTAGKHLKKGSYCLSNEELYLALCEKLFAYAEEDLRLAQETGVELPCFYSLSVDDLDDYCFCECEKCSQIINESGYSGYLIRFLNKIAKEASVKYPFMKIEFLAYANFIEPPKDGTLPEKNVITRLADLFSDVQHSIYAVTNQDYLRLLKAWSMISKKAGSELYIWDYMYNMRTNYPQPLFLRLKETVKGYYDHGVTGVFVESENKFADMWDLNNYMWTHLLEDPDADADALIDDFITRYYGKASEFVKKYVRLLEETSEKYMLRTYCCGEDSAFNYIDVSVAVQGTKLLEQAKGAVGSESPFYERISWLKKPLDAYILLKYLDLRKYAESNGVSFDFDRENLKKQVLDAIKLRSDAAASQVAKAYLAAEAKFIESRPDQEENFPIPEILADVNPEDIYQFDLKNLVKFVQVGIRRNYGCSYEVDKDACISKVMKLSYDKGAALWWPYLMHPTSKDANPAKYIRFTIKKNDEFVVDKRLFKEDIRQNGYHLYKIGSVSGIRDHNDVRFGMFGKGFVNMNLSGLAVTFPMDACDVYVSMKYTGEVYGGNAEDENAVWLERVLVVRKL